MKWTEERIKAMIDTQEPESLHLDYKGSEAMALKGQHNKKEDIITDITAFANTDGGLLIYGVKESSGPIKIPEDFDDGIDPGIVSREQLAQVVRANIHPKLDGIRIWEVSLSGPRAGKVAYVIEIPQSHTAHQAPDKRYHKRFETTTDCMEGYEVRDAMNRSKTAQAEVHFSMNRDASGTSTQIIFSAHIKNTGTKVINNISFQISSPQNNAICKSTSVQFKSVFPRGGERAERINRSGIIYPDDELALIGPNTDAIMTFNDSDGFRNTPIDWVLYADDMPPKRGRITIAEYTLPHSP